MYAQSVVEYIYTEMSLKMQCMKKTWKLSEKKKKNLGLASLLI